MKAKVESEKGFYFGDPCYVLSDDVYYGVWGNFYEFQDCSVKDPATGLHFAVHGTAYGDGGYRDQHGNCYGVDSGTLALIPLELVEKKRGIDNGVVVLGGGVACMEEHDGVFNVYYPSGWAATVNTSDEADYGDEDDEMGYDPYLGCYTDDV